MDQPEEGSGRDTDDQDAGSPGRDADGQREEQVVTSVEEGSISNEEATHTAEGLPVEKLPMKKGRPKGSKNKPREKAPSDTIVPPAGKKKRGRPKGTANKDGATRKILMAGVGQEVRVMWTLPMLTQDHGGPTNFLTRSTRDRRPVSLRGTT